MVAPGSVHPDTGTYYKISNDSDIAEAPQWMLDYMQRKGAIADGALRNVAPCKVSDDYIKSMVGIKKETVEMILEPQVKGARSEKSFSVLCSLIFEGFAMKLFFIFSTTTPSAKIPGKRISQTQVVDG